MSVFFILGNRIIWLSNEKYVILFNLLNFGIGYKDLLFIIKEFYV